MINKEKVKHKITSISLIYDIGTSCNISGDNIVQVGINLLSVIDYLESINVRVKLDIVDSYFNSNEGVGYRVTLKNYSDKLDISRMCFPLAHPSMQRRIGFRWLETYPNLVNSDYINGYGTPLDKAKRNVTDEFKRKLLNHNEHYICYYDFQDSKNLEDIIKKLNLLNN